MQYNNQPTASKNSGDMEHLISRITFHFIQATLLNEDTMRELGLYSYRVMYEIKPDNFIEVLAVIHKRRHLEAEEIPREQ